METDVYVELLETIGGSRQLRNIKRYSISGGFDDPFDRASITLFSNDIQKLREVTTPLLPFRIYIANRLQFNGRIDRRSISANGEITIEGRDYRAAMCDAHVDPNAVIKKGTPLDIAILTATKAVHIVRVRPGGFNEMRFIMTGYNYQTDPQRDPLDYETEDNRPKDSSQGIFEYVNPLAKRYGFVIQTTPYLGQICLAQPEYRQEPIYSFRRTIEGTGNNVLSGTSDEDYSNMPTYIEGYGSTQRKGDKARKMNFALDVANDSEFGQLDAVQFILNGVDFERPIPVTGRYFPSDSDAQPHEIQLYRPIFINDKEIKNEDELKNKVYRELAERTAETLNLEYDLDGHVHGDTNYIYGYDTMARVTDEIAGVYENLYVRHRSLDYSEGQGQTTRLRLIRPNSYLISP